MSFLQIGINLKIMIRIIKICITFYVIILSGCITDEGYVRNYTIINDSNYTVGITFFDRSNRGLGADSLSVILEHNDSWSTYVGDRRFGGISATDALKSDSIIVRFADEKWLVFTIGMWGDDLTHRNLLFNEAYEVINEEQYTYYFTNEDYELADPIVGQ
jgi:hypothetical protein